MLTVVLFWEVLSRFAGMKLVIKLIWVTTDQAKSVEMYQKCTILNVWENVDIVVDNVDIIELNRRYVKLYKLYWINFCFTSLELLLYEVL